MAEYRKYISALRQCAKEHENDKTPFANIRTTDLCNDTADLLARLEIGINKAIEELRKEIEENHLNVIDYADGEWIVKEFVYGAIERLKRNIGE